MKHLLFIFMILIGFSAGTYAQQVNPSAKDLSTVRFTVIFNLKEVKDTVSNTTVKTVIGDVVDPIFKENGPFTGANVVANYFLADANGEIYLITSSNLRDPLQISIRRLDGGVFATDPAIGLGVIYQPTPNLLLPQWVTSMSSTVQGALLSHMANMIDLTLSQVATENFAIKTTDYTLNSTDDTILFDVRAGDVTLTLPPASSSTGKSFKIGKIDESDKKVNFSPALVVTRDVLNGNNLIIPSLNYPRTFLVQSDGTNWWVINQN